MIITQLVINNFGIYRARHEFDLCPRSINDQVFPVILFGGKNGSGKTTILEAIRLCLHGRLSLGGRIKKEEYEQYLVRRIHQHSTLSRISNAQVGLQFEHVHAGVKSIYKATRSWRLDGNNVIERIAITKDGMPFHDVMEEHWDDFLRDLIPPGIADLFFFDGEKIQALADENRDSETLRFAVRGLLNLDIIDRLQADLIHYLRQQKKGEKSLIQSQSEQIQQQYDHLHEKLSMFRQDRAQLQSKHDYLSSQLERFRTSLVSEGALFIKNRQEIENRLKIVDDEINRLQDYIRTSVSGLIPFAITPNWVQAVAQRLRHERDLENSYVRTSVRNEVINEMLTLLRKHDVKRTINANDEVMKKLEATVIQHFPMNDNSNSRDKIRHLLSENDRDTLFSWIHDIQHSVPTLLSQHTKQLLSLEEEERRLLQALKQIPEDQIGNPLIDGFNQAAQELGGIRIEISLLDEKIQLMENELAQCERQRMIILQKVTEIGDDDTRVDCALRVQLILAKYLEDITDKKLVQLELALAEKFNLLIRKEMLIKEVKIDRRDFTVTLFGPNRVELSKTSLSAGEKQMYATALLWALRLVSGRALPIVIDTPMGRLDSDHRRTLIDRFLPLAAHQVVILSTDTEINHDNFTQLQPAISHTYILDYNQQLGCTEVSHGYFAVQQ